MDTDLLYALQYHQAGKLDEARKIYQNLLTAGRESADVLHLLGVLTHQQGEHERATEMIARVIALNPAATHTTPILQRSTAHLAGSIARRTAVGRPCSFSRINQRRRTALA